MCGTADIFKKATSAVTDETQLQVNKQNAFECDQNMPCSYLAGISKHFSYAQSK
jgi:hypothetical protein